MRRCLLVLLALGCGCEDEVPEPAAGDGPQVPTPASTPPAERTSGGTERPSPEADAAEAIDWDAPDGWEERPNPTSMRKATYAIPGDDGEAEMSVTQVGGGVDRNIARWERQFHQSPGDEKPSAKRETREVNGLKVTIVELSGTYTNRMMGGDDPKEGWALLGAIVHTEPAHFFKLTGPEATVSGAREGFDELVQSLEPE